MPSSSSSKPAKGSSKFAALDSRISTVSLEISGAASVAVPQLTTNAGGVSLYTTNCLTCALHELFEGEYWFAPLHWSCQSYSRRLKFEGDIYSRKYCTCMYVCFPWYIYDVHVLLLFLFFVLVSVQLPASRNFLCWYCWCWGHWSLYCWVHLCMYIYGTSISISLHRPKINLIQVQIFEFF